ncbi:MAG: folate-binding protein YgfZ [Aquabacterium sp.]|nr:folate-binding protein YgfZ [Aquabacterium sp.]
MIMSPMSSIQLPDPTSWGGALLLSDLGIIQAEGADAANFLHGQFSQDVNGQPADEARLAAYCSAKGRMLASLLTLRPQPEQFWLLTDSQVLPGLLKRLSMFVLRAKAKLTDASASLGVVGLLGSPAAASLGEAAQLGAWCVQPHGQGLLVGLPEVLGAKRWYWVGPKAEAQALASALPAVEPGAWAWLDVMSGIPRIEASTVDQFVPQMVNYELIGGVNFKKGCYPGQEVVARSQYRGTTKRRAFVVHAEQALPPGQEVFSVTDPGQPAGLVINSASAGGVHSALIELKLSALDAELRAGAADGVKLMVGNLPYALPSAEEAA